MVSRPGSTTLSNVWLEDTLPAGATAIPSGSFTTAQAASGTQSIGISAARGAHQWSFSAATATLNVVTGDYPVASALINPCNPPPEILFAWCDGASEYRAA